MAIQSSIPIDFAAFFPAGAFMVVEVEAIPEWVDGANVGHSTTKRPIILCGVFALLTQIQTRGRGKAR